MGIIPARRDSDMEFLKLLDAKIMDSGRRRRRHWAQAPSATSALFAMAFVQSPLDGVHAYSPSIGTAARRVTMHRRCQSGSLSPHAFTSTQLQNKLYYQNTALFSATSDFAQGTTNNVTTTTFDAESFAEEAFNTVNDETVFDNLLPSTMVSSTNSRMVGRTSIVAGRKATGLSSSVLLPLSETDQSQQNAPLFQTNNQPSTYIEPTDKATSWKERLVDVSNLASLLCVLDCTLLPLVSIAIPALSWGVEFVTGAGALGGATTAAASSNSIMAGLSSLLAYLPALSHGIALYFVIPVGLLTTIVNYLFGHKEVRFSLLSFIGVTLIYAANSSSGVGIPSVDAWLQSMGIVAAHSGHAHHAAGHVHDACGAVVGAATGMMAHTCPEGLAHRLTNTLGCAFLLGSNYASRKYMEEKSQGCAASALAEAWGGDSGGRAVCPPGCGCEAPSYGTSSSSSARAGGEAFFQWERTPGGGKREAKSRSFTRFRR